MGGKQIRLRKARVKQVIKGGDNEEGVVVIQVF